MYKNRYTANGELKQKFKYMKQSNDWFMIKSLDKDKADQLVILLKKNRSILSAYIEIQNIIIPQTITYPFSFYNQWHLTNTYLAYDGSLQGGINIENAWTINKGRNDVIIAVCDGGVDYRHPNLDPGDRSRVIAGYDTGSDDSDPMDDLPEAKGSYASHGTHIAGIIGANPTSTNNISGIMQNCKIMPVKMVGSGGIK